MAKGANAKNVVINKIAMAFGADYIGEVDKKVYVWADDGGEKVQIAIALTCPKTQVAAAPVVNNNWDFENMPQTSNIPSVSKVEITDEEKERIADMMSRLGL